MVDLEFYLNWKDMIIFPEEINEAFYGLKALEKRNKETKEDMSIYFTKGRIDYLYKFFPKTEALKSLRKAGHFLFPLPERAFDTASLFRINKEKISALYSYSDFALDEVDPNMGWFAIKIAEEDERMSGDNIIARGVYIVYSHILLSKIRKQRFLKRRVSAPFSNGIVTLIPKGVGVRIKYPHEDFLEPFRKINPAFLIRGDLLG